MDKALLERIRILEGKTIEEAVKQMDDTKLKILFVVDKGGRLLGTITNGDFRRWYLAGHRLDQDIKHLYNKTPKRVSDDYDLEEVKRFMVIQRLEAMPIVDKRNMLIDALFWEDIFGSRYRVVEKKLKVPVIIMAGGEGTRLSPYTKILPKPLIPIGDKPVVEVIIDKFAEFGCENFCLLLGYKGAMVQSYFDNANVNYKPTYLFEDEPSGTAGALRLLKPSAVGGSFFVSNCDIIVDADYTDIYDFHETNSCDITIVGAMRHFVIPYGVLEIKNGGSMDNLIEKPKYDLLVSTGMYVLRGSVLSSVPTKGIFHFTDMIDKVRAKGGVVKVYPVSEKSWLDIGQLELLKDVSSSSAKEILTAGGEL